MNPADHQPNRRILLIDDNPAIHDDFRKILVRDDDQQRALDQTRAAFFDEPLEVRNQASFTLESAYQGEEGVARLRQSLAEGRPYAMAFIDMRMPPGMDGLETAAQLWALYPELQVVICTAYSDYSWEEMVAKIGNSDQLLILKKPFESIEVLQLAHALTNKWALSHALNGRLADLEVLVGERTHALAATNQQLRDEIAERTRAESQIRDQARLLDEAQDAILVGDLDGVVHYWNASAERLYGWSTAEAVGRKVGDLMIQDESKFLEAHRIVLERGAWIGELRQRSKDGRTLTIEGHWTLVRDEEGRPQSILAINTDITERNLLRSQLLRAQRMESLGTLAGGIAHDLNNALSPVSMAIGLLQHKIEDPEILGMLKILESSTDRSAAMVRQILSFARGVTGERIALQPEHLITEIIKIAADTFPKNLNIEAEIAAKLWNVMGDSTQIHQILLNLCVNARDAMPAGGRITISAANVTLDEAYVAMNQDAKGWPYVLLEVRDTGSGMPPTVIEKIFDPFFTTKEIGKGTGLGLSTSLGIVKSHGGFFVVRSEVGQGTSFQVYLPAECEPTAAATKISVPELIRGEGELVLMIDDEAQIRAVTRHALEAFGYRVLTASEGAEATVIFAQRHAEIAIVLTDMMMPVMDGPATIAVFRKINPNVKIIASSGLRVERPKTESFSDQEVHFLAKPYTAEALLRMMAQVLVRKRPPAEADGESAGEMLPKLLDFTRAAA